MRALALVLAIAGLLLLGCVTQQSPTPTPVATAEATPIVTPLATATPAPTAAPTEQPTATLQAPTPTVLKKEYYCNKLPSYPPQNSCETIDGQPTGMYCNQFLTMEYNCVKCGCPTGKACDSRLNICKNTE